LGGPDERVRSFSVAELASCLDIGPLNVLLLVRTAPDFRPPPLIPFLHEDASAKRIPKKGLITKREVRLLSLAALELRPDSVVWDVGAASGSVAIEAAMLAIEGRAPAALADLEAPDAVFVGGSKGSMEEIIDVAWDRLRPGGRLVVNAIT